LPTLDRGEIPGLGTFLLPKLTLMVRAEANIGKKKGT
jgi:hypothetical protein